MFNNKEIANLDNLISIISDEIVNKYEKEENMGVLNNLLNNISSGDLKTKQLLKEDIKCIINNLIDKKYLKKDKINEIIKQYHINYFEKIYTGENREFNNIINKIVINKDDDIKTRLDVLSQIIFQELYGFSVIDPYCYGDIESLNEINCDRKDYIWFQINGLKEFLPNIVFKNEEKYSDIVKKSTSFDSTNDLKPDNPEVLCQRINGARVTATIPPYSKHPSLNIRFFNASMISKQELIKNGSTNEDVENFIDIIMAGRPNIFVFGDQGTGKTTYLLRLICSLNDRLSILTMESMFELNIDKYFPNKSVQALKFLNIKNANDAFQTALRKNRDIIIDGEVRSPEEADVTLQAMTRQSKGSMGSFHTTSSEDFMYDYKNLLMKNGTYTNEESALYDISRAVDILIFQAIDRKTGRRYMKELTEVILDRSNTKRPFKLNTIFKYDNIGNKILGVNKLSDNFIERALEYEFNQESLEELEKIYKKLNI